MSQQLPEEFTISCQQLGLEPETIGRHWRKIRAAIHENQSNTIPIADTCRPDNGGIIRADVPKVCNDGVISFIPAAGASSRYYEPFNKLKACLERANSDMVSQELTRLKEIGVDRWPIPGAVATLFQGSPDYHAALQSLSQPKGLLPAVVTGDTFFDFKLKEDLAFSFLAGSVFIVSPHHRNKFLAAIPESQKNSVRLFEQGPGLSTIRFAENLEPVRENDGSLSVVPAGHGMLAGLIPKAIAEFPGSHSVLIRNIDNIIGTSHQTIEQSRRAANFYNFVRQQVQSIRNGLAANNLQKADESAKKLADTCALPQSDNQLWRVQEHLFHTTKQMAKLIDHNPETCMTSLYNRPVNCMGMVPNIHKDIGGTPVFATLNNVPIKICLEVPHASASDKQKFLADPAKATHFNPVFVLAEGTFKTDYYQSSELSSWLLAKKNYKGRVVYYHEMVLYELLGNNLLANTCFFEIPRSLFNPHKTPSDGQGRAVYDWE